MFLKHKALLKRWKLYKEIWDTYYSRCQVCFFVFVNVSIISFLILHKSYELFTASHVINFWKYLNIVIIILSVFAIGYAFWNFILEPLLNIKKEHRSDE